MLCFSQSQIDKGMGAGKAAGKAKKYVGRIGSKLVRNIKGESTSQELAGLQSYQIGSQSRARLSVDLSVNDGSGEDQMDEPLEKDPLEKARNSSPT